MNSNQENSALLTKLQIGLTSINKDYPLVQKLEDDFIPDPSTNSCFTSPVDSTDEPLVAPILQSISSEYFYGEAALVVFSIFISMLMNVFLGKARLYYQRRKKIQKTKKFLSSAENKILRKTEMFFDRHREETLELLSYLEHSLKENFELRLKVDEIFNEVT